MKKIIIFLMMFLIVGCSNNKDIKTYENYDDEYYKIFTPYKEKISNYSIKTVSNIDLEEVEVMLMELSKDYFDINKLYYQQGQYLTNEHLNELLSKEKINNFKKTKIGNVNIDPYYISTIYEQNYLNEKGNLNGISLGIVLNPYQSYKNSYGNTLYKEVSEGELLKIGREKTEEILEYVRDNCGLKNIRILVGLFIQSSPNSLIPGSFKEYGITNDNEVKFKELNYKYYDLDNISEIDSENYQAYQNLKDTIKKDISNIYISGYALYREKDANKIIINITYNNISQSDVLYLNQLIGKKILKNFNEDSNIKIYIKNNNKITSMLFKQKSKLTSTVYLVD